jgi:hypothetical protein
MEATHEARTDDADPNLIHVGLSPRLFDSILVS